MTRSVVYGPSVLLDAGGNKWTNLAAGVAASDAATVSQLGGAVPSFATPAIVLGSSPAAGSAGTVIRSDGTIAAFDANSPSTQAFGDAAAVGTAAFAARRDHKHAMPAAPTAASVGALAATAAAGGDLTGNYPNPTIAAAAVTNAKMALTARARDYHLVSVLSGVIQESVPRWAVANNGSILSTARLTSCAVPVLNGDVITNVSWLSATTALSAPANVWFALCDSSFNVIRQSTDQVAGATWAANSVLTLAVDSVPVTAGARVASSTVTLTFPTLSQALSTLFTAGDSITVSNANIAAYNGTFTVASVGASTITYVSGGSATDSLVAPFPTVKMAAGKRTYTVGADGYIYCVVMVKGTVPTLGNFVGLTGATAIAPVLCSSGDTALTGTCPSPIAHGTGLGNVPWTAVS